jgi:hypothetical protein
LEKRAKQVCLEERDFGVAFAKKKKKQMKV